MMQKIFGSENFLKDTKSPVVTLGNFDGVHLGHRFLIDRAIKDAKQARGTSVVYTFDPHPVRILAPAECPAILQTLEQKLDSIEETGVDICVIEKFTKKFAALTAEKFFETVVARRLKAKECIVGHDFTFGLHRHGSTEKLLSLGKEHGVKITILDAKFYNETLISSTAIRRLIEQGEVNEAAKLLGRPYAICGKVVKGRGIGGELGAHTANIESVNELIPKNGVYETKTIIRCKKYASVTSIGTSPTFRGVPFAIETHIIGIDLNILGENIEVDFVKHLRDQIAFKTKEELKEQIRKDIETAGVRFKA